jgi:hypothetical protein
VRELTARCTGLTGVAMRGTGSAGCRRAGASTRGRQATNITANIWPVLYSRPSALPLALSLCSATHTRLRHVNVLHSSSLDFAS